MKCVKCGSEIKAGCLYCDKCGHEVQIVTETDVLEEDYLKALLKGDLDQKKQEEQKAAPPAQKKNKSRIVAIVAGILFAAALVTGILIKLIIDRQNANSYDYQVEMAEKELGKNNTESALSYYNTALSLIPEDVSVRMAMADIYMAQTDYDAAMVLYLEVVRLDSSQREAYERLIQIYERNKDYENIQKLSAYANAPELAELFAPYFTEAPIISPISETYDKFINVNIDSLAGDTIYYTMDGSTPDAETGIPYNSDTGIPLNKEGEYTVRAVCVNDKGIYSEVSENTYLIKLVPPREPVVTPDGGTIEEETTVSIRAEAGCSIYYTWDGSNPTEASEKYQTPLVIPEGNTVLSVLVVDDTYGLKSNIYRTNFIYFPEETEE